MAGLFEYGPDRHYYPVVVSSTSYLYFEEGGTTVSISISAGRYYLHRDSSRDSTHKSLLLFIENKLNNNANLANTYQFFANPPYPNDGGSPDNSSLGLMRTAGTAMGWGFSFGSYNWTFDPMYLGIPDDQSADIITSATVLEDELFMPQMNRGKWRSFNMIDGAASDKTADPFKYIKQSTKDAKRGRRQKYYERDKRSFRYDLVPGAHVWPHRANDQASAKTGSSKTGDNNNAFYWYWDAASEPDSDTQLGAEILIVHDEGDDDLLVDSHPYEVVRWNNEKQLQNFRACLDLKRTRGEMYEVTFDTLVLSGNYDQ